jgi:hypothetical protein
MDSDATDALSSAGAIGVLIRFIRSRTIGRALSQGTREATDAIEAGDVP